MAHWIIEDKGFGGTIYQCSNCGELWNDLFQDYGSLECCPFCGEPIDRDKDEYIEEIRRSGIIGEFKGDPVISIYALISWLTDQKYINIDETSDTMTEEFEKEHQWELSRNCFINNMIRKLEEIKNSL